MDGRGRGREGLNPMEGRGRGHGSF
ncbi:hypothetical protein CCACVL1_22760 [Corchorus capsularis]|uniref:Uncharacterized protein n=1 Tax=Corchorus capsularis TaxID=210143 RepID=A0A1R3GWQ0_COCAP|nr:hypothetical protein CCACVL1_22760 [Corchorus capsularis]